MNEGEPRPGAGETPTAKPSYEQISQKLTTLFESAGGTVKEEFPQFAPKGTMAACDPRSQTLALHPWISPRGRAEELLHETVNRFVEKQAMKRGKKAVVQSRGWVVESALAKHYGLRPPAGDDESEELTPHEQTLVDHIKGSIEHASS